MQAAVLDADRPGRSPAPVCSSFNHQKDSWTFWTLGLDGSKLITLLPFWQKKPTNYPSYFLWTFLFLYLFASVEVSWRHLA